MFTSKDFLLTHQNCWDGAGCAIVFHAFGGSLQNVSYSPPGHSQTDAKALELVKRCGGTLYLADVSVSENAAQELNLYDNVLLFDHHNSAIPLAEYSWCEIDKQNTRCGSKIFLDYAKKSHSKPPCDLNKLEELITVIDDRDRWVNQDPRSATMACLFKFFQQHKFVEIFAKNPDITSRLKEYDIIVQTMTANTRAYVESALKRTHKFTMQGYKFASTYCDMNYISDVGNAICEKQDVHAVLLLTPTAVSLRAKNLGDQSLDVSKIAQIFGGGGHKMAAGFGLENLAKQSFVSWATEHFQKYDISNCNL